jgi:tyrosyl-tRNA synthetase
MGNQSELLVRAVEEVVPLKVAEEKLQNGKPMRIYMGIDPTGAKLHLGHSVPLRKMRAFQDAGHHVILLIGSFTAMIGDPTGRDVMRAPLTKEDVAKNFETYIDQAKLILDMNTLEIAYNHEWLETLTFKEILSLTSHFTVHQMLKRDMFVRRMEEEAQISLTEFMYPLMVGYDSVALDVDAEIGGNDQLFNMLAGRTLMKEMKQKEKFVLTTKLIDGTDGRKMSKTYNNCVYLTDEPEEMYGKLLSMPDHLIPLYMECCTDISMTEIEACKKALETGSENPKHLKMRLAREIVTMYHSEDAAKQAEEAFEAVFKDKGIPEDIPEYHAKEGEMLVDALLASGLVESKGEARRLIEQGGVKVNDVPVSDVNTKAEAGIVRVGKRKFLRMIV